jgi:hypothetical protein
MKMVAIVLMILSRDLVKKCTPLAKVDMVSSMGAVRKSVSPRIAKRTTVLVSGCRARIRTLALTSFMGPVSMM